MTLAALRGAIRASSGPVTGIELAHRLGITPSEVAAMLDALRASGQLSLDGGGRQPVEECGSRGACSLTCPGPGECSLVIDLSVANLQIRSPRGSATGTAL